METPFVFGKIASDKNFTDRKNETERVALNFNSSVNTILISPRRWGKSSLVAIAYVQGVYQRAIKPFVKSIKDEMNYL